MMQLRNLTIGILGGVALAVALPAMVTPVMADQNPAQQLTQLLEPLHTYSADFHQDIQGDNGQAQQSSTGHMWLARPGKFRWVVNEPYAQTVVSDGQKVYLYDPDLEQVTIRKLDPRVSETPALLLSGSADQLTHDYNVSETNGNSAHIFTLTPKSHGSLFQSLDMTFTGNTLTSLNLTDATGQKTVISFNHVKPNESIDASRFVFHIPKGADVENQ